MNLPLRIARRYLFAKRSTNAINIITGIAVFGVSVGAAALVLVLSVFNGFEDLFLSLYNSFNPDLRVTPALGKTFDADSTFVASIEGVEGVGTVAQVLEEVAFFEYKENQDFGILKGVDDNYRIVNNIDSTLREGNFELQRGAQQMAIVGLGVRNKLGIDITDEFSNISVHIAKRRVVSVFDKQFNTRYVYPGGSFLVQQDFDNQYVLVGIDVVRGLLQLPDGLSALEIKLKPGYDQDDVQTRLAEVLGPEFVVKDRYEQEEAFLRLMNIEKWLSFAIVGLMMLLISFNLIGALWMIVLEKQKDIAILKSMGMRDRQVRNIFLLQGTLLCLLGVVIGFLLALLVYGLQKTVGIITLPVGMLIDAYPVSLRWWDFPIVATVVITIGLLAAILPARRAKRVDAMIREE